MRPMMGFAQVDIDVYAGAAGTVEFIITEYLEGRFDKAGDDVVCGHSQGTVNQHGPGCNH